MNPITVKSNDELRKAILADRPSLHLGEITAVLHYCEEQYLMLSHPTKHLMIEFKLNTHINVKCVERYIELAKDEIFRRYNIKLYVRQVAFNKANIITMYTMIKRSPKSKRRQIPASTTSSGFSSDSESVTLCDRNGNNNIQQPKQDIIAPIAFMASSAAPRHTGELEQTQFNGTTYQTPIIRTSTSQQTDQSDYQVEETHKPLTKLDPPTEVYKAIEFNKNELQVLTTSTFSKVRRYLAYFKGNQEVVLDGESYLDLKIRISNDGLTGEDSEIERAYYTALQAKGLSEYQISSDLKTLGYNLQAKKVREMNASRNAYDQFYSGRVKTRVQPPIQSPPGRFDPEICTIA